MARRRPRYVRILKTTVDLEEIGHDLVSRTVDHFVDEGRSEASAVRTMLHLCSIMLERPDQLSDALKQVSWLSADHPLRKLEIRGVFVADPQASSGQRVEPPRAPRPIAPNLESAAESAPPPPAEQPANLEKSEALAPKLISAGAKRPSGMLSGLKSMAVSAETIDPPQPSQAQSASSEPAPARKVAVNSEPQSPAAMASTFAAKRASGR